LNENFTLGEGGDARASENTRRDGHLIRNEKGKGIVSDKRGHNGAGTGFGKERSKKRRGIGLGFLWTSGIGVGGGGG